MCPSSDAAERIAQARQPDDLLRLLPWSSFAEFVESRVQDGRLAAQTFLAYYDDEQRTHRTYTYPEFGAAVERMSTLLRDGVGLRRGERLATVLFNHDATVVVYFAAWTLGVAIVPINAEESAENKAFIVEHSECAAVACWPHDVEACTAMAERAPALRAVLACADVAQQPTTSVVHLRARPDRSGQESQGARLQDEAFVVYTSGTTGTPKGVVLTVQNLLLDADAICAAHRFGPHDRVMCVLPIHHVNGTVVTLLTPFYCRGSAILHRRFRSGSFWRRIEEEQVTCVSVVPTLLEFLLESNEDTERYRLSGFGGVICGAGPLLKETAARFEERFRFPIRHGYGLSETTCYSCFLPLQFSAEERRHWLLDQTFPSIGVPLRHSRMAILDESGRAVPEGMRGEICIRGGIVCAGYDKRPDANEAAFQWGWFRSGDEGYFLRDEQGRALFFISGRQKELIIRGGVNISPLEIDEILKGHPDVKCAMAVAFDHRYYGEEIAAYVVPRDPARPPSVAALADCCRPLPFWKRPKVFLFGDDLFYTATGKPKRLELKSRLAAHLAPYRETQFKEQG